MTDPTPKSKKPEAPKSAAPKPPGPPDPPHRAWDGHHSCPTCRGRCRVLPDVLPQPAPSPAGAAGLTQNEPGAGGAPIKVDLSKVSIPVGAVLEPGTITIVPADRIPTPDGVNVAEVMKAAAAIDKEKALAEARRSRHMPTCQTSRNAECDCPANLYDTSLEVKERVKVGPKKDVEVIRVDDGRETFVIVPDPQSPRSGTIKKPVFILPRWVCTNCGWAARMKGLVDHHCDEALLIWKSRAMPLSATVSREKLFAGAYRLTIWRDKEGKYHVGEVVIENGMLIAEHEIVQEEYFPSAEAVISDRLMSEFEL